MIPHFVPFDSIRRRVMEVLCTETLPAAAYPLYVVRNLHGRIRISVADHVQDDVQCREALRQLAGKLSESLAQHGYTEGEAVLFVPSEMLELLREAAEAVDDLPGVHWIDRLMTGSDWSTVTPAQSDSTARRYTLFSVKGGVGRSTTAAVLASHLANKGERVMVVDLDLESPGLSSAVLDSDAMPVFGVSDWFVEDLVGQGERVIEQMTATLPLDFDGDVFVVPAHGQDPGEYLAKLGRVYVTVPGERWTIRLAKLLFHLERHYKPTIVLLESRSGLHDIAASAVTDLDAHVLLFAVDSTSTWVDYGILFKHWQTQDLASYVRQRLSVISALTPTNDGSYVQRFRERSWELFRHYLYDPVDCDADEDPMSFDLNEDDSPHSPMPIYWNLGLAPGASLRDLPTEAIDLAYGHFLPLVDKMMARDGRTFGGF